MCGKQKTNFLSIKFASIVMINAEGARTSPGIIARAAYNIVGKAIVEAIEAPEKARAPDTRHCVAIPVSTPLWPGESLPS